MIDCSKCIHYEVCSNRFSNDGCEGVCGFYLQDIRPHGEWKTKNGLREGFYICSNCGEISCCKGNFCCDCGADMRGDNIGKEETT